MENEPCLHGGTRRRATTSAGPDGLEAWGVCIAACFINLIMAGLGRMTGILYVAIIHVFGVDRQQASLPFIIRSSTRNLLGPIVGILGQKYGVRPIMIIGGIIGTISAAACFEIYDILWLTIVWGGINGIGTALTTTLPQVVIGQHFDKHRSTASGVAFSGGCVGSFLFPALIEYLLYKYGIEGTYLIISGIIMHVIPFAMVLKPPSWLRERLKIRPLAASCKKQQTANGTGFYQINEAKEKNAEFIKDNLPQTHIGITECNSISNSTPLLHNENSAKELSFKCDIDSDFLWQNRHILTQLLTNDFTVQYEQADARYNKFFLTDDDFLKEMELLLRQSSINVLNNDINFVSNCYTSGAIQSKKGLEDSNGSTKSESLNGNVNAISINYVVYYLEKLFQRNEKDVLQNFSEEQHNTIRKLLEDLDKLNNNLINYKNSIDFSSPLSHDSEFLQTSDIDEKGSHERSNTFCSHIKTALKLYLNPMFLLICMSRAVHFMTFVPAMTIIVDFAMDKGLPESDGKYVIASLSFGDLLGRLCFGWITDRGYVTLPRYMLFVIVLQGISTLALPCMLSKTAVIVSVAVFGLFHGASFIHHPVLVSHYIDSHEQYIAMGCINFFSGLIGLLLPLYIGYFRDTVGSYNGLFYINGTLEAVIGLLWVLEPILLKISPLPDREENQQTEV